MSDNGHNSRNVQVKGFVAGLLVGGTVGVGTALLKAPRSGEETRQQIQEKASEIQSKAEHTVEAIRERVEEAGSQVVQRAEDVRERVKQVSSDVAQSTEELEVQGGATVQQYLSPISEPDAN